MRLSKFRSLVLGLLLAGTVWLHATVDDSLSFAMEAAYPYVQEGFVVREDYWGGDLGQGERRAIRHQLFRGNEYWFWVGTDVAAAKVTIHIYDAEGKLAESESWQREHMSGAKVVPPRTGSYWVIVEVAESPHDRTHWAVAYGYR